MKTSHVVLALTAIVVGAFVFVRFRTARTLAAAPDLNKTVCPPEARCLAPSMIPIMRDTNVSQQIAGMGALGAALKIGWKN